MLNTSVPVICPKCGWNHFGVSREYAENQAREFYDWWVAQTKEVRLMYSTKDDHTFEKHMRSYTRCFRCGNDYKNLVMEDEFTSPTGSTLQPIIFPEE